MAGQIKKLPVLSLPIIDLTQQSQQLYLLKCNTSNGTYKTQECTLNCNYLYCFKNNGTQPYF